MPDRDDNFEARLVVVERELARLRERVNLTSAEVSTARADASAGRTLAAGADHDVSEVRAELRAHRQALNALRETQLEHGQRIDALAQEMHQGFAELRAELRAEMREGFAIQATGMAQITALLTKIIGPEDLN
ncbi:MAG: hypothetical protein ACT4NY_27640 [Pseudonocardiales bacterium]